MGVRGCCSVADPAEQEAAEAHQEQGGCKRLQTKEEGSMTELTQVVSRLAAGAGSVNYIHEVSGKPQHFSDCAATVLIHNSHTSVCSGFGPTYTKIGTIQRRLAWPLRKDDTQIREAFQIFFG